MENSELLQILACAFGYQYYDWKAYHYYIILNGKGTLRTGDKNEYLLEKGTLLAVFSDQSVQIYTDDMLVVGSIKINLRQEVYEGIRYFPSDLTEWFIKTFEYGMRIQASTLSRKDLILQELLIIFDNIVMDLGSNLEPTPAEIKKILSNAYKNLTNQDYNINEEIAESHYSPGHARKLIREATGYTPVGFLNNMRIEYAKETIRKSKHRLKIQDLAIQCGFQDVFYFSRLFKKITGVSPSEYERSFPRK